MFNKSPGNLFCAVFNIPQNLVMTLSVSFYQGIYDPAVLLVTFVESYCAGFMLSTLLRLTAPGEWLAGKIGADKSRLAGYLVINSVAGLIMGFCMNLFMTFMAIGPVPYFASAFLHTLPVALIASVPSSNLWSFMVAALVKRVYPE